MYLLINTNFLVPQINSSLTLDESIQKLQNETISRNMDWVKNIYVIQEGEQNILYTTDGTNIYKTNLLSNTKKHIYTNKKINYCKNEYWLKYSSSNESISNKNLNKYDNELDENITFTINDKKNKNIIFDEHNDKILIKNIDQSLNDIKNNNHNHNDMENNNNITNGSKINETKVDDNKRKEDNDKKNEIIKMIEEVNGMYQIELTNIKKLELNLKTYDTKLKKLEKTKRDNIINNIIRTQSEYKTWKKIKYGLKDSDDYEVLKPIEELEESNNVVPILFLSKYNYIDKIQNNVSIKKLFNEIILLNLNDLYSSDILPSDNIVQFCNKYMKLSKELHYHFDDHEWSYLENEMNLNSTNKLGSNVVSSNKIQ